VASIIWYKFLGGCNGEIFQTQATAPPASFAINGFYYLQTDVYIGCSQLLSTGFTKGVTVYNLVSYDGAVFTSESSCVSYYPCVPLPSPSPTLTNAPTQTYTKTVPVTSTPPITPGPTNTASVTRTPTNTPTRTITPSISPTKTVTPTYICPAGDITITLISNNSLVQVNNNGADTFFIFNGNSDGPLTFIPEYSTLTLPINLFYTTYKLGVNVSGWPLDCVVCRDIFTSKIVDCNLPNPTQTPTNTPSNSLPPSPTTTPVSTSTPTKTKTPSVTPTITKTPSITPTNTPTISLTPSNTPTTTPPLTPIPTLILTSTPTSTLTPTITKTPTTTFYSFCPNKTYCVFTNMDGYTQYDGIYYNYTATTENGKSVYYCPQCSSSSFIYYNSGQTKWCISNSIGGDCKLFGKSPSNSFCPDFNFNFFNTICPTTTPTPSTYCEPIDFSVNFDCAVPGVTLTPTISNTPTKHSIFKL
jgi:hypothetical protein